MKHHPLYNEIAIIGAACRFPGDAHSLEAFWQLLKDKVDAVTELPLSRCGRARYFSADAGLRGHAYTAAAGIIRNIQEFDPDFFNISRTEAVNLDPQQRLALETAWEALEQAHIIPSSLRGKEVGVFMGASNMDMSLRSPDDPAVTSPYSMTGSTLSIIANRISYIFDLHGPSLTVDTACSSSLVAVHLACEALRHKQVPLAIAGGVNALLVPYPFIGFSQAHMLSPDGRCKAFDASGNGYVRSEGAGTLILKPLAQARKDGDTILGIIAGSGVNSDGRTTGIALPNEAAQAALLEDVYRSFGLNKKNVAYVEAHGTGTAAGDPIETAAIGKVLGKPLAGIRPLHIGSVKSNIGHLEPAAGMAGLIKALLVLRHGSIPPNLHLTTPNPAIDFAGLNLRVPTQMTPLPSPGPQRLVSVNSFGFGGTNAHVVLKSPPRTRAVTARPVEPDTPLPFFITARSRASLSTLAASLAARLEHADGKTLYDTATTLALHREHMRFRAVVEGSSASEVAHKCKKLGSGHGEGEKGAESALGENLTGVFAFSGNGSQWPGMGRAMLLGNRDFREAVEEADSLLLARQGWSLVDFLLHPEKRESLLERTEYAQPLLFAVQVGLVRALAARGIYPAGVIGHSVGEVAGAWAAGALSLKDAATVIHFRSKLQAPLHGKGVMAVAGLSEERALHMLASFEGSVEIAAVNTEDSLTLAGEEKAVRKFLSRCKQAHVAGKMLNLPYPFHTKAMETIHNDLLAELHDLRPQKTTVPFYSTARPAEERDQRLDARYWWHNIRNQVLFRSGMRQALTDGGRLFLEIGPHPILRSYIRDAIRRDGAHAQALPTLSKEQHEPAHFESAWKNAWLQGWKLDASVLFPHPFTRRALPLYPWNKEFLWPEDTPECRGFLKAPRKHPLLGWALPGNAPVYENTLNLADMPWLADHKAGNSTPYPAAAYIESMLAAATEIYPGKQYALERVTIHRPIQLSPEHTRVVRLCVDKEDGGCTLESRAYMSQEPFGLYARGRILPIAEAPAPSPLIFDTPELFGQEVEKENLYATASRFLLHYGPSFQTVEKAWLRADAAHPEVLARFAEPAPQSAKDMLIPPTLLDGAFQTLFLLLGKNAQEQTHAYLPAAFDRVTLFSSGKPAFAHARLERISTRSVLASFHLMDETGRVLLHLSGCRFRRAAWLEYEKSPAKPYTMELVASPHPETVQSLKEHTLPLLLNTAASALNDAQSSLPRQNGLPVHPYMLLHLAAVSAAHEVVLSLCEPSGKIPVCSIPSLLETGKLAPEQEPWLHHLLERLESAELATSCDGFWQIAPLGNRPSAQTLWRTIASNAPCYLPEVALLARVMRNSRKILAGELQKDGQGPLSPKNIAYYFSNSLALMPHAGAVTQIARTLMQAHSNADPLHILQISREPKAMLHQLLPVISTSAFRYSVAEKDSAEAQALALHFDNTQAVDFRALDLAEPPAETQGKQHLIIASFAMHEQPNPEQALAGCYALLAPGGILCLLEHSPSTFADFVFGSHPSWWNASLEAALPVSRLQSARKWKQHLRAAGFAEVTETAESKNHSSPAFLLLARKPHTGMQTPGSAGTFAAKTVTPAAAMEEETPPEAAAPVPHWLLAAGEPGSQGARLAEALKEHLTRAGHSAAVLCAQAEDLVRPELWAPLLTEHPAVPLEIVFLAGFDTQREPRPEELEKLQLTGTAALAALAQAWDASRPKARLWVLTGGAMASAKVKAHPVPSQGALWGFARVLRNEMRTLEVRALDLHGEAPDLSPVAQELLFPSLEHELVFTAGSRYAPRLDFLAPQQKQESADAPRAGVSLAFDTPGRLQNLYWKPAALPLPQADEVCIAVKAVGMNFRDVMWSMGLLQDEALENGFSGPTMGIECSGVISVVGGGVKEWKVGDAVICFAPACFSSHVVTHVGAVAKKPENLSFAEAATLPVAFMTAWYGIKHLADMQPGERILIHGAAGGVGLAAIQIAAHLGLEVYATAGSPEKHDFLRQLGVRHIFSSRSLAFAPQLLEITKGQGVDAVLNSLAGEAIPAGISTLRPFGRFLELGKRDFYADSPLRLRPFSNNISFFGIDIDQLLIRRPELGQRLFAELVDLFSSRQMVPLPYTRFPATRVVEAFQTMQQSAHIGKIVVSVDRAEVHARTSGFTQKKLRLDSNASYLITGGTGGFGLATAERLARRGAGHLLLLSRNGLKDKEAQHTVNTLRDKGVTVVVAKVDIADSKAVHSALKKHLKQMPPLRGVVHAAALLNDGIITSLTPERIAGSLAAKSLGAWNIHSATLHCPLDFFVLYSSATTAFGNPGQAGYVAANCMLETLASWRKSMRLPAQVIGWGPIADTGMLKRNPKAQKMLHAILGVTALSSAEALYWLENCIAGNIGASHFFGLDWHSRADMPALASTRFAKLRPRGTASHGSSAPPLEQIRACSAEEGMALLANLVREEVAATLRLPAERVALDVPIVSLGMDSLMAVELALALEQKFELTGFTFPLSESTTPASLAGVLHPAIMGGPEADFPQTGIGTPGEEILLEQVMHKHGAHLSQEQRSAVLETLERDTHEH